MVADPRSLREIADPVERIRAVNEAMAEARVELASITRETVREMRKTMSLAEVAKVLGVTRARVQQLQKPL